MLTSLRAFLLIRDNDGEWTIGVFHGLNEIVDAWDRAMPNSHCGVLHVGFDRRDARSFETIAQEQAGRLLLTPGARGALPSSYKSSSEAIGDVEGEPIYLALDGWGYTIEDPVVDVSAEDPEASGWVREFIFEHDGVQAELLASEILNEETYVANEGRLTAKLRAELGKYRSEKLLGLGKSDPTEIARSAPPWLSSRSFSEFELTVRLDNVFRRNGIDTVSDLARHTLDDLFKFQNFGRTSCRDLCRSLMLAIEAGPTPSHDALIAAIKSGDAPTGQCGIASQSLVEAVENCFLGLKPREADILKRRMGWERPPETLEEIGADYSVSRERIRQIESKTIKNIIRQEIWDDLLGAKLKNLLSERKYPLPLIGAAALDPWFTGLSEYGSAARYLITKLCDAGVSVLEIDGVEYLTFLKEHDWATAIESARQMLVGAAEDCWPRTECEYQVGLLLPEASTEFRGLLWDHCSRRCHFAGEEGEEVLISYGNGADQVVEAVLHDAEQPLHYSEIAQIAEERLGKAIDERRVHNAAAEVGYLFGPGTYGTLRHMAVERGDWESFAAEAIDIVYEGERGRQWHASELLLALTEREIDLPSCFDKYQLDIALKQTAELQSFGRMVWSDGDDTVSSGRVDIRQAVIAIVKDAGSPITTSELRQRLVAVRGINEGMQFHVVHPLIKLDAKTWGINDRDIDLKYEEQRVFLNTVYSVLRERKEPISITESARMSPKVVPNRALRCLFYQDERFRIDNQRLLSLAEWK